MTHRPVVPPIPPVRGFVLLLGLLAWAAGPAPLSAQETSDEPGEIRGQVTDLVREEPIWAARISIPELGRRRISDGEGRFVFEEVPPGRYTIRVEFLGYETEVARISVAPGETRRLRIRSAPGPVEVLDLEVVARSLTWFPGFLERREEREGHFFTRQEIADRDPGKLSDLLRGAEGVHLGFNHRAHGPSKEFPQFFRRGTRRGVFCRPAVFVNGEMMGPGEPYWFFNEIPPEQVLAMEVYHHPGEVPETIEYDGVATAPRNQTDLDPELSNLLAEARRRVLGPGAGSLGGAEAGEVVTSSVLPDIFDRDVPTRDDQLSRTVLAGLYESPPQVEHCGAIFVWTRFHPVPGG